MNQASEANAPTLHVIDGKVVVAEREVLAVRVARFFAEPFVRGWHQRDLIATILRRELHERFKGSIAGWIWAVVAPLLSLVIYTLIFSGAVKVPDGASPGSQFDYALFIFGGLIAFNFFSEMAYRGPLLLHEYAHFIKQTMFPAEMLSIISTFRATAYSMIGLVLMLLAQVVLTGTLHWTSLLLPLWYVPFLAFLIGLSWLLSALGAFTRDTVYLMTTLVPLSMFATPVFFSIEEFSPELKLIFYVNILTGFIEIIRDITVFGKVPQLMVVAWTFFMSAVTFYLGFWFFGRQRDAIADVI